MRTEPVSAVEQCPDRSAVPGYLDFSISVTSVDGEGIVHVNGDLDSHTAPQLRSALRALADDGTRHVTLDIGGTQFVDSTGLSVLVGGLKRLRDEGGNMVLKAPTPATLKLFEITGVRTVFDVA